MSGNDIITTFAGESQQEFPTANIRSSTILCLPHHVREEPAIPDGIIISFGIGMSRHSDPSHFTSTHYVKNLLRANL